VPVLGHGMFSTKPSPQLGGTRHIVLDDLLSAVLAHRERTGAVLLAEGIESDEHHEQALAMDATLGQGYSSAAPNR
jgi:EAL domain-containing protein (putative c-di-GMP-specific phosphodiesterase class I)